MELRVLNYFLIVAREENMTRAADLLHVTQPTLSRQLMQLEEELGVKLFKRSSHSIILTSEGMLLKRRAQEILSLTEKAKEELSVSKEKLSGTISIGCGELASVSELGDIIAAFREKHPLVNFDLYSGNSDSIKLRIEQGTLDVGLLLEPVDIRACEFVRMNTKEEWAALVRCDSPLADRTEITADDLINVPLILPGREKMQGELSSWFGDSFQKIDRPINHSLPYNAAVMVQKGMGVMLSLRLACHYDNLKYVSLSPRLEFTSLLVWKERQIFSPLASAFIDFAKERIDEGREKFA